MKVSELIKQLEALPPNHYVVVRGYEGGVDDVNSITVRNIRRDLNREHYYGSHEVTKEDSPHKAVLLDYRPK